MFRDQTGDLKPLTSLFSLAGKRALITGSASGIGCAVARRFAESGASLDLVDLNSEGLEGVRAGLSQYGVDICTHTVDLSKKEQIDRLWDGLSGSVPDILVNNAGIYPFKDFTEVDEAFLNKVRAVNLDSVFWMCQHMVKRRAERGGTIINVGSIEAILPFKKELAHYCVSKSGVIALTRSLARDYGKNFKINVVVPGGIVTPGTKNIAKDIAKLKFDLLVTGLEYKARLPAGRFGYPDEVALMVLVLATDLSSYVNGAIIPVDGGFLSA
jgi:NAD(P)-dependent dehydrogenase (short-subunit alcohol dehydrogenase family)